MMAAMARMEMAGQGRLRICAAHTTAALHAQMQRREGMLTWNSAGGFLLRAFATTEE
jgi:hypothetical protein